MIFKIKSLCTIILLASCFSACKFTSSEDLNANVNTSTLSITLTPLTELLDLTAPWENRCGVTQTIVPGEHSLPASIIVYLSGSKNKIVHPDLTMGDFELSHTPFLNVSPGGQWFSYWQTQNGNSRRVSPPILEIQSSSGNGHYNHIVSDVWFPLTPWYSPD
jgi:hypothetical protein